MRHVDKDKLGIALKSANEMSRFFSATCRPAGKMLWTHGRTWTVRADVDERRRCLSISQKDLAPRRDHAAKNLPDDELVY